MFSLSSNIKSVNKTLILNICSVILLQGISFFTGPIFTRILGAEQYGLYSVFNAWVSVLACVMGFNVSSALVTARYQFKNSYELFKSSVLLFGTIICGAVAVLCICFIRPIAALTGYSYGMVILLLLMAFAKFVIKFAQDSWTYEKKAQMNFFVSAAVSIMSVSLSLLMVFSMSPEIRYLGKIYGYAIPHIIAAVIIWFVIYLKKPAGMNLDYWKYSLTIGFPVIFHSLSQNILTQSDRLMMEYMNITNSSIGIYSVFYGLTAVLGIILSSLNTSWCPFYYDDLENKKWEVLDRKCKNYIELFVVLTCGFILLSREAGYLYAGKEYYEGINVIPILVLAIFFTFMYQFPVNFEFFHKKTNIIAVGTMGAAVSNIILNAIMIPRYGMYGAAMATAISYAFLFLAHYTIVKHFKNKFHLNIRIFIPGLLLISAAVMLFYVFPMFWYIRWGIGGMLGIFEIYRIWKRKSIF